MEFIIVTGLSGAGRSAAIHCLEDMGYYCIDNMPPSLIGSFIELSKKSADVEKAAFVVDARAGRFFKEFRESLDELERKGVQFRIIYLEASDSVIIRRYKETRRRHPLSGSDGTTLDGIERERKLLAPIRDKANYIVDTSNTKVAEMHAELRRLLMTNRKDDSFTITVESFGFKRGVPQEADCMADMRFLPNPFYIDELKHLTGNDKPVFDYVMNCAEARRFADVFSSMILDMIPSYIREGKYSLTIAIGCTGGQHRSVTMANELARIFKAAGKHTVVIHRDL